MSPARNTSKQAAAMEIAGDAKVTSRQGILAVITFLAPLVRKAVGATDAEVANARMTLDKYLVPLVRLFDIVANIAENTASGGTLLQSPRTAIQRQARRIERVLGYLENCTIDDRDNLLQAAVTVFIHDAFPRLPQLLVDDVEDVITCADAQRERLNRPFVASLDALIDDAPKASPEYARRALATFDVSKHQMNLLLSVRWLRPVAASSGEDRAELAMQAARRISETIYRPYVKVLYHLWGATRGRHYGDAEYGAMVRCLLDQAFLSSYPNLLDANAVLVRNAAAHDSWDYDDTTDSVVISDRDKLAQTFSVDKVLNMCSAMLETAGVAFPKVLNAHRLAPLAKWVTEIEPIWRHLLDADSMTRRVAFELLREWFAKKRVDTKRSRP